LPRPIAKGGVAGVVKYQEQQEEKRIEAQVLQSLGLKSADLSKLSPDRLAPDQGSGRRCDQEADRDFDEGAGGPERQSGKRPADRKLERQVAAVDATTIALFELQ